MLVPLTLILSPGQKKLERGQKDLGHRLQSSRVPAGVLEVFKHFVEATSGVLRILKDPNIHTSDVTPRMTFLVFLQLVTKAPCNACQKIEDDACG